jgi:hypothetical protein
VQDVTVFNATDIRLKAFVRSEINATNFFTEFYELRIVEDAQKHLSIPDIKSVIGRYIGMSVTPQAGRFSGSHPVHGMGN